MCEVIVSSRATGAWLTADVSQDHCNVVVSPPHDEVVDVHQQFQDLVGLLETSVVPIQHDHHRSLEGLERQTPLTVVSFIAVFLVFCLCLDRIEGILQIEKITIN
jgi:hypothetical protein